MRSSRKTSKAEDTASPLQEGLFSAGDKAAPNVVSEPKTNKPTAHARPRSVRQARNQPPPSVEFTDEIERLKSAAEELAPGEPMSPELRLALLKVLPNVPALHELLNLQHRVEDPNEGRGDDGPAPPKAKTSRRKKRPAAPESPEQTPPAVPADDEPTRAKDYVIQTSQEVDALMRAASDGRSGDNWHSDNQSMRRVHELPGSSHRVELSLSEDERAAGLTIQALEALSFDQDPDFNFAMLYISRLLAPPAPLPLNMRSANWIDLDDIMEKIGWDPRSRADRLEMRNRIWRYILFGARAAIVGQRTSEYVDRKTGERIETVIDSPAWAILERERPAQPTLYPEMGETPVRVELIASRKWTHLTTQPETAQYLPMGELLGAIPGNRPSGAWARVVGLSLANFWRRNPRAALDGSLQPTRRELLERFKPATGNVHDILKGNDPKRALIYWDAALQILVGCGFLAPEGEADEKAKAQKPRRPRKDWQEDWLNETVDLRPGPQMLGAVGSISSALPPAKKRDLRRVGKNNYRQRNN